MYPQILDLFQGLKIGVPSGCLEETCILKITMIDDVTLWSKLESTWEVYSIVLILFRRQMIFKILTLEQSVEKCLLEAGGGRLAAPTPTLATGLSSCSNHSVNNKRLLLSAVFNVSRMINRRLTAGWLPARVN